MQKKAKTSQFSIGIGRENAFPEKIPNESRRHFELIADVYFCLWVVFRKF